MTLEFVLAYFSSYVLDQYWWNYVLYFECFIYISYCIKMEGVYCNDFGLRFAYFSSYDLGQYSWNYVYYTLSASYIFHIGLRWNMK